METGTAHPFSGANVRRRHPADRLAGLLDLDGANAVVARRVFGDQVYNWLVTADGQAFPESIPDLSTPAAFFGHAAERFGLTFEALAAQAGGGMEAFDALSEAFDDPEAGFEEAVLRAADLDPVALLGEVTKTVGKKVIDGVKDGIVARVVKASLPIVGPAATALSAVVALMRSGSEPARDMIATGLSAIDAAVAMNQAEVTRRTASALTKGAYLALNVAADMLKLSGLKDGAVKALDGIGTKVRGAVGKLLDPTSLINRKTVHGVYRPNMFGEPVPFDFTNEKGKVLHHELWLEFDGKGGMEVGTASVVGVSKLTSAMTKPFVDEYGKLQIELAKKDTMSKAQRAAWLQRINQIKANLARLRKNLVQQVQNKDKALEKVVARLEKAQVRPGMTMVQDPAYVLTRFETLGIKDGIKLFDLLGFDTLAILDEADKRKWGEYLKGVEDTGKDYNNKKGDALDVLRATRERQGMVNIHAHHIVMEKGQGQVQQDAVKASVAILRRNGIPDHTTARENLVWAPNRGHTDLYAQTVLNRLKPFKNKSDRMGVTEVLAELGQEFIDGKNLYASGTRNSS